MIASTAMHRVMKLSATMLPQPIARSTGALSRRAMPNPTRPASAEKRMHMPSTSIRTTSSCTVTRHPAACGGGCRAEQLPADSGRRALADVVLREAEVRLSVTLEGTVCCVQDRARLVRALYERLDRLQADGTVVAGPAASA